MAFLDYLYMQAQPRCALFLPAPPYLRAPSSKMTRNDVITETASSIKSWSMSRCRHEAMKCQTFLEEMLVLGHHEGGHVQGIGYGREGDFQKCRLMHFESRHVRIFEERSSSFIKQQSLIEFPHHCFDRIGTAQLLKQCLDPRRCRFLWPGWCCGGRHGCNCCC
jgi:hypothetical protein